MITEEFGANLNQFIMLLKPIIVISFLSSLLVNTYFLYRMRKLRVKYDDRGKPTYIAFKIINGHRMYFGCRTGADGHVEHCVFQPDIVLAYRHSRKEVIMVAHMHRSLWLMDTRNGDVFCLNRETGKLSDRIKPVKDGGSSGLAPLAGKPVRLF